MDAPIEARKQPVKKNFDVEHNQERRQEAKRSSQLREKRELLDAKEDLEGVSALRIRL